MATIFISDNCAYTKVPSYIRSAKAYAEIENGTPVVLGGLIDGEREVFTASDASASSTDIWVVTSPELMYDETPYKGLSDFVNAENSIMRVVKLVKGDIFSITGDKITGTPVVATAGGLKPKAKGWTAAASASGDFAKLIEVSVKNGKTFYAYEVL